MARSQGGPPERSLGVWNLSSKWRSIFHPSTNFIVSQSDKLLRESSIPQPGQMWLQNILEVQP